MLKNIEEYTRYCITEEGKEYLKKMLEEKENDEEDDIDDEIDFDNLRIVDDEEDNDEAYDFWKETRDE